MDDGPAPAHLEEPRDLRIQRDFSEIRYEIRDWDHALPAVAGLVIGWMAIYALLSVPFAALSFLVRLLGEEVLLYALLAGAALATLAAIGFAGLLVYALRGRRSEVRIDARGVTVLRGGASERYDWSSVAGVQRNGRLVTLEQQKGRITLPSPTAYVDAMWLERIAQEAIAANAGREPGAPPTELAALRALTADRA